MRVRAAIMFALASLPALGWADSPFLYSAVSSASYSSTIAQGSLFVVFGANIGPTQLLPGARLYPLTTQLGTTSITIMSLEPRFWLASNVLHGGWRGGGDFTIANAFGESLHLAYIQCGQSTPFPVLVNVVGDSTGNLLRRPVRGWVLRWRF